MAEESGGLRGIGPQHPQALNALIGNAEMARGPAKKTRIRPGSGAAVSGSYAMSAEADMGI